MAFCSVNASLAVLLKRIGVQSMNGCVGIRLVIYRVGTLQNTDSETAENASVLKRLSSLVLLAAGGSLCLPVPCTAVCHHSLVTAFSKAASTLA